MARTLIGSRIRDRRKTLGTTQLALAQRVGISPSYLNLIESDRRNIGGTLLKRIADELRIAIDEFDGAPERRLVDDLLEVSTSTVLGSLRPDSSAAARLAAEHPLWARALVALHRACLDRDQTVASLSDRLTHDPFLGDAVHRMLSKVTAVRSACEILAGNDALQNAERERFLSIIGADSQRLAEVASSLAAFFDKSTTRLRSITPSDEVDDFIMQHDHHFPVLEAAADLLRETIGLQPGDAARSLTSYLAHAHGVSVRIAASAPGAGGTSSAPVGFDPDTRCLTLTDLAWPASRRFVLARLAAELACTDTIASALAGSGLLHSEAAHGRARRALAGYVAGALLLPYTRFLGEARRVRYDVDALCRLFDVSFEQVCHRLTTLRRAGDQGLRFGFLRVDAAGHMSKRLSLPELPFPRHGHACPLWAIYEASRGNGRLERQLVAFPSGARFLFVARALEKSPQLLHLPRRSVTVMLACDVLHASHTAYADGIDLSADAPAVPVGQTCRTCVRRHCAWRQEAPIVESIAEPASRGNTAGEATMPFG